jgi:hypothetical protein
LAQLAGLISCAILRKSFVNGELLLIVLRSGLSMNHSSVSGLTIIILNNYFIFLQLFNIKFNNYHFVRQPTEHHLLLAQDLCKFVQ